MELTSVSSSKSDDKPVLARTLERLLGQLIERRPGHITEIVLRLREDGSLGKFPTIRHIKRGKTKATKTIEETIGNLEVLR